MVKRFVFAVFVSSLIVGLVHARGTDIVGVITKVETGTIDVKTDAGETTSVALNSNTVYMKWIMRQPWQQDPRAGARFLRVGKRVHVEVAEDNPRTARTVWIVVGRTGFD